MKFAKTTQTSAPGGGMLRCGDGGAGSPPLVTFLPSDITTSLSEFIIKPSYIILIQHQLKVKVGLTDHINTKIFIEINQYKRTENEKKSNLLQI